MESNATHTPGPWMAYNSDNGRILKHWRIRGDCVRNDPPFAVVDSGGKMLPEYEAANARLMAAAPALLAACEEIIEHETDDWDARMRTIRAAVAAAKG
jgi:hypothetical protein